jgi:hypothetical protein
MNDIGQAKDAELVRGDVSSRSSKSISGHDRVAAEDNIDKPLPARTREIQGEAAEFSAEIIELEAKLLGQPGLVTPDQPAHTQWGETELVARSIDGCHSGQVKVPMQIGPHERRNEPAGRCVHVDRDIKSCSRGKIVKRCSKLCNGLVMADRRYTEAGTTPIVFSSTCRRAPRQQIAFLYSKGARFGERCASGRAFCDAATNQWLASGPTPTFGGDTFANVGVIGPPANSLMLVPLI